jgi:3',5'-cyclic AMP phosphodiesterase CpdA
MNRRKFLVNSSLLSLATGFFGGKAIATPAAKDKKASLRFAFLSDVHIKPTEVSELGMRKAFRHVNSNKAAVDFIINGGDSIMDAMKADKLKVQGQWDVWNKVVTDENRLPMYHCIGNHDAWGWQMTEPEIKSDPLYNKAWVVKELNMPNRFYSFKKTNWKFIVLDSAHENNGGYIAKVDDEQFVWLENELKETPAKQNIAIISHIPIVSFCSAMFFDKNEPNGDLKISRALLHTDTRKVTELFTNYKNIRCCLSGHIHMQDAVEYKGIKYFCNGAISGNWWNGAFKGFEPAYAIFQFYKDGNVKREMVNYS